MAVNQVAGCHSDRSFVCCLPLIEKAPDAYEPLFNKSRGVFDQPFYQRMVVLHTVQAFSVDIELVTRPWVEQSALFLSRSVLLGTT